MTMCIILQLDNKVAPTAHHQEAGWPSLSCYSVHRESLFCSLQITSGVLLRRTCLCLMMVTLVIGLSTLPKFQCV